MYCKVIKIAQYVIMYLDDLFSLSQGMVVFATQICAGMEFLETQKAVHRDLAARNILVSFHVWSCTSSVMIEILPIRSVTIVESWWPCYLLS